MVILELFTGEAEHIVGNTTGTEVGNLDSRPNEGNLDADTDGVIGLALNEGVDLFNTLRTLLGLQRQHQPLLMLGNAVVEVLRLKLELLRVLVRLVIPSVVDLHLFLTFLFLDGIDSGAVVPGVHLLVLELALLTLIPDGAVGLIDADDVHIVMQCSPLLAKHLLIGVVEDTTGLTGIGRILSLDTTKRRQQEYDYQKNSISHSHFFSNSQSFLFFGVQNY